jgi:sulfur-oxidizing protein SoxY
MGSAISRRAAVAGGLAAVIVPRDVLAAVGDVPAGERLAPSALYVEERAALAVGREIATGRVRLELPRLAENGNSVTLRVSVESPMTDADYVRSITLLSEQNPVARIAQFTLSPRAGRAEVSTSVRLATTQNVHAIAEMSNGALFEAQGESVVLLAACLDGG